MAGTVSGGAVVAAAVAGVLAVVVLVASELPVDAGGLVSLLQAATNIIGVRRMSAAR
jgi:hypothetical protein